MGDLDFELGLAPHEDDLGEVAQLPDYRNGVVDGVLGIGDFVARVHGVEDLEDEEFIE